MKTETYFNKMKAIKDKAVSAAAAVISAPAVMKSKMSQSGADLKFEAMKMRNSAKNMPDYNSDGGVTEGFRMKNSYRAKK